MLRDSGGQRLYIPWGCDGNKCPQYAADPGNPDFQRMWIDEAARKLRAGYRGLYVDDASLAMFTSDASGRLRVPIDPRTGRTMRAVDWRRYVVEFLERIRRAFPQAEIVHNANWWVVPLTNPLHRRQARAADWVVIEHAFTDWGLTGGRGPMSFRAYLRHMDGLHRMSRRIVFDGTGDTPGPARAAVGRLPDGQWRSRPALVLGAHRARRDLEGLPASISDPPADTANAGTASGAETSRAAPRS